MTKMSCKKKSHSCTPLTPLFQSPTVHFNNFFKRKEKGGIRYQKKKSTFLFSTARKDFNSCENYLVAATKELPEVAAGVGGRLCVAATNFSL